MVFPPIANLPLVTPLANWIWGADPSDDVSPVVCLSLFPFVSSGCFSQLIAKGLGVAIILASCVNKTPIMMNMYNVKSAAGISRTSLYFEWLMYSNGASYSFLLGHPFTAYGENVSLLVQTVILVLMSWQFSPTKVNLQEQLVVVFGALLYCLVVLVLLPVENQYLLMTTIWPISIYARGNQIFETFSCKHTGSLSIVTTSLNVMGNAIRILTTLKETGDVVLVLSYFLGLFLNLVMWGQYWYYLENTRKLSQEMQEKKKE
jgi:mannose-P-dolichol utilization defect 1